MATFPSSNVTTNHFCQGTWWTLLFLDDSDRSFVPCACDSPAKSAGSSRWHSSVTNWRNRKFHLFFLRSWTKEATAALEFVAIFSFEGQTFATAAIVVLQVPGPQMKGNGSDIKILRDQSISTSRSHLSLTFQGTVHPYPTKTGSSWENHRLQKCRLLGKGGYNVDGSTRNPVNSLPEIGSLSTITYDGLIHHHPNGGWPCLGISNEPSTLYV